jgi:hypothetical protein
MSDIQEWLARAAGELALDVEIGHCETLADGTTLLAVAWFPHLGSDRGILIFDWTSNIENYRAMFADWGWAGPEHLRPEWMK